jgi:endonuclease/exonuclease/phosphatase family metal-dependent hydrolase
MVGLAPDILLTQEVKSEAALTQVLPPSYRVATTSRFSGAQQLCIAGRRPSESAWFEPWKKDGKDDPPRGFAYASFRLPSGRLLMVYTVHLKSNAGGDAASNRAKREDAARQLIGHIAAVLPQQREKMVPAVLIGGDFNTDPGRPQFAGELTVKMFREAGFEWVLGTLPQAERITWPAADGYPDAVFDHVLTKGIKVRAVMVPKGYEGCSDHRPVVVDVEG